MAATYSRILLSGSTSGQPVKVAATATLGTTVHTAVAGATSFDEIWAWVSNTSGSAVNLTVEFGGATDPDNLICKTVSVPANSGPTLLIPGLVLNGGKVLTAFAATANVLLVTGFVNRIA